MFAAGNRLSQVVNKMLQVRLIEEKHKIKKVAAEKQSKQIKGKSVKEYI